RDPGEPALEDRAIGELAAIVLAADGEIGIRIEIEAGLHALDLLDEALIPLALQREELDRFRQNRHRDERDDDRYDAADPEQNLPAMRSHVFGGNEARDAAAEGDAREHQDEERRADAARREFGNQRRGDRQHAGDADAGDEAQPDERLEILRERRDPGHGAEEQQPADQRAAAA